MFSPLEGKPITLLRARTFCPPPTPPPPPPPDILHIYIYIYTLLGVFDLDRLVSFITNRVKRSSSCRLKCPCRVLSHP